MTPSAGGPGAVGAAGRRGLALVGLVVVLAGTFAPLAAAPRPPLTDLPFHAAFVSILAHLGDPAWGFGEQFTLTPLAAPTLLLHGLGALLAQLLPVGVATRLAAGLLLALLPLGAAVLARALGRSPLLGLAALPLTWGTLTHWGFVSFVAATGLELAALGLALELAERPTPRGRLLLGVTLAVVLVTHVSRLPLALAAALAAPLLAGRGRGGLRAVLPAVTPAAALFAVWAVVRPAGQGVPLPAGLPEPARLLDLPRHVFGAYRPMEGFPATASGDLEAALGLATLALLVFGAWRGYRQGSAGPARTVLAVAGVHLALYLTLPMSAGRWFYVYPREATAVFALLAALLPDPRRLAPRRALVLLAALGLPLPAFAATRARDFARETRDFEEILAEIPPAPRLFGLIYWHGGSESRLSPFLHFPAWVQAERGGALAFHFASWGFYPLSYRRGSAAVPPELPEGFEWHPEWFRAAEQGAGFDTFLIRHQLDPSQLFADEPGIRLVARRGTWWLYRRAPG